MADETAEAPKAPQLLFEVVAGNPSPEQLAALTATVAAIASSGGDEGHEDHQHAWSHVGPRQGGMWHHGRGAWSLSSRTRF